MRIDCALLGQCSAPFTVSEQGLRLSQRGASRLQAAWSSASWCAKPGRASPTGLSTIQHAPNRFGEEYIHDEHERAKSSAFLSSMLKAKSRPPGERVLIPRPVAHPGSPERDVRRHLYSHGGRRDSRLLKAVPE